MPTFRRTRSVKQVDPRSRSPGKSPSDNLHFPKCTHQSGGGNQPMCRVKITTSIVWEIMKDGRKVRHFCDPEEKERYIITSNQVSEHVQKIDSPLSREETKQFQGFLQRFQDIGDIRKPPSAELETQFNEALKDLKKYVTKLPHSAATETSHRRASARRQSTRRRA